MEVSVQLYAPSALPLGERTPVPIVQVAGWAAEAVWTFWRSGYVCTCWTNCSGLQSANEDGVTVIAGINSLPLLVFRVDHERHFSSLTEA